MMPKITVIIPCYNEGSRFTDGAEHFLKYLVRQKYSWEIVFINDGSVDNTLSLMEELKEQYPGKIKIINYQKNQGKGYAIKKGVEEAEGEVVIFSDIDHSVDVQTIEEFLPYFDKGVRVVVGSRRVNGSKFLKKQNPIREFLGRGFTFLVKILIDFKIKDATCGFKAFKGGIAKQIFKKITIYNWAFDAELLFICKKMNINYAQIPVSWEDKKGSKVNIISDTVNSLFSLVKIRLNDLQDKY